jgi:hypothetical protein
MKVHTTTVFCVIYIHTYIIYLYINYIYIYKFILYYIVLYCVTYKGKGKAVPLQAWSGPEGSRNLRFPDCMTTAQDGGKVVGLTHRPALPQGNAPGTHFC